MKKLFTCFFILSLVITSLDATNVTFKDLSNDCTYKTGSVSTTRSNCADARKDHIKKLKLLGIMN